MAVPSYRAHVDTTHSNQTNPTFTPSTPTGTAAGDLVVVLVRAAGSIQPGMTVATPAGWTALPALNSLSSRGAAFAFYRIWGVGTTMPTFTSNSNGSVVPFGTTTVTYRDVDATTPVDASTSGAAITTGTTYPIAQLTTTRAARDVVLAHVVPGFGVTRSPTGYSAGYTGRGSYVADREQTASGLTPSGETIGVPFEEADRTVYQYRLALGGGSKPYVPAVML